MKKLRKPQGLSEVLKVVIFPLALVSTIFWFPVVFKSGIDGFIAYFIEFWLGALCFSYLPKVEDEQ
jgi:hypothetical protein